MTPAQVADALRQIADAVDVTENPNRVAVAESLRRLVASMGRTGGKLTKFVGREKDATFSSLNQLSQRLEKVSKNLNPQDPARSQVAEAVDQLEAMKSEMASLFSSLDHIDI